MKIVNADWEERNFGVTTQELIVEDADTEAEIERGLSSLSAQYQVVKLPVSRVMYSGLIERRGFSFIETIVHIDVDRCAWGKALPDYKIMTEAERDDMVGHIAAGMFHTDRFSMDPFFPKGKVAGRYVNVVHDELGRGAVSLGLLHDGEIVGFAIIRKLREEAYVCPLCGIYPQYLGRKLSELIVGCGLAYIEDNGGGTLYSGVSSNNIASLRTHMKAGHAPNALTYLFIKHVTEQF
ncbi:MAG: GNAT family N-acetyltransferase [Clostridiales Family XIII bacterium]|nr:GNAT family N-acetyltransferase [Clostridiales Family XIII bacterium]